MRSILFFLFCGSFFGASAQDLTGIWRGQFKSEYASRLQEVQGLEDKYKFEVQLDQNDKAFKGVTYSYKTTVFYGKASCYGAINSKTKKVLLEELKILEVKTNGGGTCIMTCFLTYSREGDEEFMEGKYSSMNTADSSRCGGGTVYLRKVATSDFYKEPFLVQKEKPKPAAPKSKSPIPPVIAKSGQLKKLSEVKSKTTPLPKIKKPVDQPAAKLPSSPETVPVKEDSLKKATVRKIPEIVLPRVLTTRTNELIRTITTTSKNIYIKIYDNGSVDNDTVSVYIDKKLVVSKQRLTETAIEVKISLDDDHSTHELVMVAENLGEIPPNTSLMVVKAGDAQYEVRITSTEQKNAVVLFKYEPE